MSKYSDEVLAEKHHRMKELWKGGHIQCEICGKEFFKDSEMYNSHMLFQHGVFMPTCSTKQTKQLEWNCIKGFAQREEALERKRLIQKGLRLKRRSILSTFRKFWENINNEYKNTQSVT